VSHSGSSLIGVCGVVICVALATTLGESTCEMEGSEKVGTGVLLMHAEVHMLEENYPPQARVPALAATVKVPARRPVCPYQDEPGCANLPITFCRRDPKALPARFRKAQLLINLIIN
jgi:hypothetical protein